ncbi:MAG: UDP-N-acetylmuramoyl-tripeptide--D-alanyl-D-alanine ligase, partial [Parcubacteria group bacterium]
MAVATLKMRKPKVVGITGSVGKTSAKEAIFRVLEGSFKVRKNEENYNNEIGVPLTIIGAKSGEKNIFKWLWVGIRWIFNLIFPFGYPKILILEMAIDRPGDMKYLTSFARPEVGVLTDISASHLEFFDSLNSIAGEKSVLLKSLPENGLAVVNVDNEIIRKIKNKLRSRTVDFGIENEAKIRATDIKFIYDEEEKNIEGLSFKLNQEGNFVPIRLYHIIARHHVYAVLAAVAVGNYFKINLIDMAKSLENLKPPRGRMTPIEGIKGSLVVDDSYNASPVSAIAALNTVEKIRAFRRVAILGDMMELGE